MKSNNQNKDELFELFSMMEIESPSDDIDQKIFDRIRKEELSKPLINTKAILVYIIIGISLLGSFFFFDFSSETETSLTQEYYSIFSSIYEMANNSILGGGLLIICFYIIVFNFSILRKTQSLHQV